MNKRASHGFTLIELLVVIAIIAILAAILFPIYLSAKEHARMAGCVTNLRQLGMAMRSYCEDNYNILPIARGWESYVTGKPTWAGVTDPTPFTPYSYKLDIRTSPIYPYIRNARIYLCPSDIKYMQAKQFPGGNFGLGYEMNWYLSWRNCESMVRIPGVPDCDPSPGTGLKRNRLSRLMVLIHAQPNQDYIGEYIWFADRPYDRPAYVHNDGGTLLFADWHAKWVPRKGVATAEANNEYHPDM